MAIRKIQVLAAMAAAAILVFAAAGIQGVFSAGTVTINAIAYDNSLYILEGDTVVKVVPLTPQQRMAADWDGTTLLFRVMSEDERVSIDTLRDEVCCILRADDEFSALMGADSSLEVRGLFLSSPSHFLREREQFLPPKPAPQEGDEDGFSAPFIQGKDPYPQEPAPSSSSFSGGPPSLEQGILYALAALDGRLYECVIDMGTASLCSYYDTGIGA
ncbi:MAG: hypothetical protein KO463_02800 [Candidatus Methanofastidiosa archaeon]|nr:hypothetical protein [Candidatus Methanofastidiosa archaeon]